jgi:hypothetical protein
MSAETNLNTPEYDNPLIPDEVYAPDGEVVDDSLVTIHFLASKVDIPETDCWAKISFKVGDEAQALALTRQIFTQLHEGLQKMANAANAMRENMIVPVKSLTPELKAELEAHLAREKALKAGIVLP